MLKPTLGFAFLCAAIAAPASAGRIGSEVAADLPLAIAIAVQGDQALREIRREARLCLRSLKPAPLDALIQVDFEKPPAEVVQAAL